MLGRHILVLFWISLLLLAILRINTTHIYLIIFVAFVVVFVFSIQTRELLVEKGIPYPRNIRNIQDGFHKNFAELYPVVTTWDERKVYYKYTGMLVVIDDFLKNGRVTLISKTPHRGIQWLYGNRIFLREDDVLCTSYEFRLYDPLLSRLPAVHEDNWFVGHMYRKTPMGYRLTLDTGINYIEDEDLRFYYNKLKFILSGDLFDLERLKELIKFNRGNYDKYLQEYIKNNDLSTEDGLRSCYIC